ncbi:KOW motif-containing protein [bacterium]|nr:KOW motif-containing protein [bacterium]
MEGWITVQLTERGEGTLDDEPKVLESVIKKFIESEYFFPVYYNRAKSYENKIYLFTGYVFIKFDRKEVKNYPKLANTPYFLGPLLVNKKIHLTPDQEIQKLKKELTRMTQPKVKTGDLVKVIDGKYKNLTAEVTDYYPETKEADLKVVLKCMNIIVPNIPTVCLKIVGKSEQKEKKFTLQKRILETLKTFTEGLSRKDIVNKMDLNENELKRVSTCLARALKKELIECFMNENGKSIFVYKI